MMRVVDAATIARVLPFAAAIHALEEALLGGLDPEAEPSRQVVPSGAGHLLVMPSTARAGVKVVAVAPDARSGPRIQGLHLAFDRRTLAPRAVLDGAALTLVRTAAVSALALARLAPDARRVVVFGAGPQAASHVAAARVVLPSLEVAVRARDPVRAAALIAALRDARPAVDADLAQADVVICCTTARTPLFDGRVVAPHAAVVAIGSHEPDAREVDEHLVARATVVVEARAAAEREAGDLLIARRLGVSSPWLTLAELVAGAPIDPGRPRLFKSVGMAWEDAVIADALLDRLDAGA